MNGNSKIMKAKTRIMNSQVKPIRINAEEITVEDDLEITPEKVAEAITGAIKEIYGDNTHLATMTEYDYYEYPKLLGSTVEIATKELYKDEEELLRKNPGSSIPDIIGFILSERLYEKERQLYNTSINGK